MAFENPVVGGENGELIRPSIQSPDYVAGVSGWTINRDGSAEFNDITIRGGAIVGGSITIGPTGMPQVVIDSTAAEGRIRFPTNDSDESSIAEIVGAINNSGLAFENLSLELTSPSTTTETQSSYVRLHSGNLDGSNTRRVEIGTGGALPSILVDTTQTQVNGEVYVQASGGSTQQNYPGRVVRGRTNGTIVDTTLTGTDAAVSNTNSVVYLENGIVYRCDVQIYTRTSSGTSAVGTQVIEWKLWNGAVGGTQLGVTVQKATDSIASFSSQQFSFLFLYSGTTGTQTITLSARQAVGTDTLVARSSTHYFLITNRLGRNNVLNLT